MKWNYKLKILFILYDSDKFCVVYMYLKIWSS